MVCCECFVFCTYVLLCTVCVALVTVIIRCWADNVLNFLFPHKSDVPHKLALDDTRTHTHTTVSCCVSPMYDVWRFVNVWSGCWPTDMCAYSSKKKWWKWILSVTNCVCVSKWLMLYGIELLCDRSDWRFTVSRLLFNLFNFFLFLSLSSSPSAMWTSETAWV